MRHYVFQLYHRLLFLLAGSLVMGISFTSCEDPYPYDNKEPDWLGESIYDYLKSEGNFSTYVRIIDDLNYQDVLSKTGSKTLFVADDEAFDRFYKNNPWGVTRYEDLSLAQKKLILNYSMINNAYLIETLSNYYNGSLQEGMALRRETAISALDTVPFEIGDQLPNNPYWTYRRQKGVYLLKDNTGWPLVHFLPKSLEQNGIADADFKVMTGIQREKNDAHIFKIKVIKRDITCKNGYIDVLEDVLIPPTNMANFIRHNPRLSLFSELLDRFCAPYYDAASTAQYKQLHPEFNDSLFVMKFFSKRGGRTSYPNNAIIPDNLLLPFDPGWNSYTYQYGSLQSDMAVIFAPTNEALEAYLNESSGLELKKRYGSWKNVPNDKLALLLTRHMRESLKNSLPSNFYKMVDNTSSRLGASPSDIIDSLNYIGLNGIVYVTNKIYPPDAFVSVYGPVFFSEKTIILNWAIQKYLFHLYLNSMVNTYAFIAPTDKALKGYIDPLTYGTNRPTALKFWYDPTALKVKATIYSYNKTTGTINYNDSITVIDNDDFIKSRLVRILDQSIVVGDLKNKGGSFSDGYYVTKDGNFVKASNISTIAGKVSSPNSYFQGGGDLEINRRIQVSDSGIYHQKNGTTFFVDELYQTPLQSVYAVLSNTTKYPEFSEFFKMLSEFPANNVFISRVSPYYGIDANVKFFNTFRYTVYVPTNEAMQEAYQKGIIMKWDDINRITDKTVKDSIINRMERFVRYHFQDNSVFIHPNQVVNELFQTATIKNTDEISFLHTYKNKFYRIKALGDGQNLDLITETGDTAHVITRSGYYNILTRDYIFSINPSTLTSLNTSTYAQSQITTSSTAVIHLIDKVLRFEK